MFKIREGNEADFDSIREIISLALNKCILVTGEDYDFLYNMICGDLDWWLENKDKSVFLVCQSDKRVLGYILIKEYWNLSALFVDPQHHGSGIGCDLLTRAIKLCKGRSPKGYIKLNSSSHASGFYKRMGFIQTQDALDKPGGCVPFELSV